MYVRMHVCMHACMYVLACLSTMFLGYLFRHCFTIFVPNFWWFGNFCPQFLGMFAPNFWEFLSPTFRDLGIFVPKSWGQKIPNSWDNNSIPMGIIVVPNFSHRNLIIVTNFLGIFVPKKVGDNNTNVNQPFRGRGPLVPRQRDLENKAFQIFLAKKQWFSAERSKYNRF